MRDYTGIKPESLPAPSKGDFHSRLREMLSDIDYWARDASFGFARIMRSQVPDGSGSMIGDGGTLIDYWYKPGISGGVVAYGGTGDTDKVTLRGNTVATVNGWISIPIYTASTSGTPDTNEILKILTSDDVNIFSVQGDGATVINVPYTTYTSGNPIALTLQMLDTTTNHTSMFRVRTGSGPTDVFRVSYTGFTAIDMISDSLAFQIEQFGTTSDMTRWVNSGATQVLLGVDGSGDIYGGDQAASTLNLLSKNISGSTQGRIQLTSTPGVIFDIPSGTVDPISIGLGLVSGTFTGLSLAMTLNSTGGNPSSMKVSNVSGTLAAIQYVATKIASQTGDMFAFRDSDDSTVLGRINASGAYGLVAGAAVGSLYTCQSATTGVGAWATAASVIDVARTWTTLQTFPDDMFKVVGSADATKTFRFELDGLQAGVDITQSFISTVGGGDRTLTWSFTGASGTAGLTLAWAGTTVARTITFPSTASFTVAGLQLQNTFTRTQTITPTAGTEVLNLNFDTAGGINDAIVMTEATTGEFARIGVTYGGMTIAGNYSFYPFGGAVGTGFSGTIASATLSASRIWTFPNFGGNVLIGGPTTQGTGQTASVPTNNIVAAASNPSASTWLINCYLAVTTAEAGTGTISVTIGWTDVGGARTSVIAARTLTTLGSTQGTLMIQSAASNAITYFTTYTPTAGGTTEAYAYYIQATKLG